MPTCPYSLLFFQRYSVVCKMNFFFLLVSCSLIMASVCSLRTTDNSRSAMLPADRICIPGPPLKRTPGKINCLIIGDSISIGYTPWVAKMLGPDYQVQHSPWDHSDGGALDSKYGLQCLNLFLSTAMLEPTCYDVIIFNFGLHDINYAGIFPEEYVAPVAYAKNLADIKSILLSTRAKVGYVLTTPLPYNITLNNRVKQYNIIARDVMNEEPAVATADLYTWVVETCGDPPYKHCLIADEQPSPHYTSQGYEYLSERIKDLIQDLCEGLHDNIIPNKQSDSSQFTDVIIQGKLTNVCSQESAKSLITDRPVVSCRDKTGEVVTVCPYNSTCCDSLYSSTGQGCCLTPQAVPCDDGKHCCPAGFKCDPSCSIYMCSCKEKM